MSRKAERKFTLIDAIVFIIGVALVGVSFWHLAAKPAASQTPQRPTVRCQPAYFQSGIVCNGVVFHLGPKGREYMGPEGEHRMFVPQR